MLNGVQFGNIYQGLLVMFILTSEDVQITKDDVPIIYHDFLISETGIDEPLHNLSLEQVFILFLRSSPI